MNRQSVVVSFIGVPAVRLLLALLAEWEQVSPHARVHIGGACSVAVCGAGIVFVVM